MKSFTTLAFVLLIHFFTQAQISRYSVVINELLADPSPVVGLPNTEFIELRNNTTQPINLFKWRISNGTTTASIGVNYQLGPDSVVVICSKTQAIFFNGIPNLIGVTSFPALSNDGDVISLIASDGTTMHAVSYSLSDYHNNLKANGGWSLEMVDPYKGCDKNNWTSSIHFAGGTPGRENSVFKKTITENPISILQAITIDSTHILVYLDQGIDSLANSNPKNFHFSPTHESPTQVRLQAPLFNIIELQLKNPLQDKTIYNIKGVSLKHCTSKTTDSASAQTGIIHDASKNDIILNEILFDPPTGGSDFIELYNRSSYIVNAKNIYLTNRTSANLIGTAFAASETDHNIFPGEYICLTTDSSFVCKQWPAAVKSNILEMKSMSSYPDDEGNAIILNKQGEIIDEMNYVDNMHFPMIRNREAVSLEKVALDLPSSYRGNWHSAASTVGYATPGYKNSQNQDTDSLTGSISISSDLITPNNDGIDDNLFIHYSFPLSGFMGSVFLFDNKGVLIKKLLDNELCSKEGQIVWDGTMTTQKASPGLYYIKLEAYHLNGSRVSKKWAVGLK